MVTNAKNKQRSFTELSMTCTIFDGFTWALHNHATARCRMHVKNAQPYTTTSKGRAFEISGLYGTASNWRRRARIHLSSQLQILLLALLISISPSFGSGAFFLAFLPRSRGELKTVVNACLTLFPKGDCSNGRHGPIGEWDVSRVSDMSRMFSDATLFRGNISKWDVSNVRDMSSMFLHARSFDGDISKWDVSSVVNMDFMFRGATAFKRNLCGSAWVHSAASKTFMFQGSSGSISPTDCAGASTSASVFSPQSKAELHSALKACLRLSPNGDCSTGPHGPIGDWDVSRVTDMRGVFFKASKFNADISKWDVSRVTDMRAMFSRAHAFNGDISKWDVSRVTDMNIMFAYAKAFNGDISKWDVSRVTSMDYMFQEATSFNQELCGSAWDHSKASKTDMFVNSGRSTSQTGCTGTSTFSPQSKEELKDAIGAWVETCPDSFPLLPKIDARHYKKNPCYLIDMLAECSAEHISELVPGIDRPVMDQLLGIGAVWIGGRRGTVNECSVSKGAYVRIYTSPRRFLRCYDLNWRDRIVHDHKDYVVVDKPAAVAVIPPVDNIHETVQVMMQRCLQMPLFTTTRLDVDTSGCLVLAKSKTFQQYFNGLIRERKVQKRYRVTLRRASHSQQPPPVPGQLLTHYTDARQKLKPPFQFVSELETKTPANQHKKWRVCLLRVIDVQSTPGGDLIVTIDLLTGRTHQIRGQFAAAGWPIVGDKVYTGKPVDKSDTFEISPRLQLRAISLVFAPEKGAESVKHSVPDTDPDIKNVC